MIISEQFIMGKCPDQALCEDGLFVSDKFIAVLDGVTSKGDRKFNNMSGGKAAAEIAIEVIKNAAEDITKPALFENINKAIASLYEDSPTGEAAVCLIIYSRFHNEIWVAGDCQCIIGSTLHTHEKLIDIELAEIRSEKINSALQKGMSIEDVTENDIGRQAIMPQLKLQHRYANCTDHPYGYTVLNGTPFDIEAVVTYKTNPGDTVVLASDGYPKLFDSLEKSEEYLKYILEADPLCFREYKSTKGLRKDNLSFDDRTYIKFTL